MGNLGRYEIGKIVLLVFLAIGFLMVAVMSMLRPSIAIGFLHANPAFSWMGSTMAFIMHILGNLFFAALAIVYALDSWRDKS